MVWLHFIILSLTLSTIAKWVVIPFFKDKDGCEVCKSDLHWGGCLQNVHAWAEFQIDDQHQIRLWGGKWKLRWKDELFLQGVRGRLLYWFAIHRILLCFWKTSIAYFYKKLPLFFKSPMQNEETLCLHERYPERIDVDVLCKVNISRKTDRVWSFIIFPQPWEECLCIL